MLGLYEIVSMKLGLCEVSLLAMLLMMMMTSNSQSRWVARQGTLTTMLVGRATVEFNHVNSPHSRLIGARVPQHQQAVTVIE